MRNLQKIIVPALCGLLLASCGGGDKSSPPPPLPAPSALSYPVPPAFTRGTTITALTPTVTGTVASYGVSPALPAGLSLNTSSGVISGTPTAVTATANYAVIALNASGSAAATLSLTVNDVTPVPAVAPSGLSYTAPTSFTAGTAIAPLTPTVTGTVISYTVAPALPVGLALDTSSGVISGTPTVITATANYVVTAGNPGGSTAATLSLTVNDVVPDIGYAGSTQVFTTGVPVTLAPTNTGGPATQWSVDQPLPAGLALNATSGVISGNPTEISAASAFVITARNSGGTDTFALNLAVQNGVLLDLGHAAAIRTLRFDGSRIVSLDEDKHMVLWNAQTGANIASTDTSCVAWCGESMGLAGATAVFRQPTGFDVRTSANGATIATIDFPATPQTWWMLATDGSYISAGSSTGVTLWAPNGAVLFSRNGNYSSAKPFAAPGELRLAAGPAGNVIEKISVPVGTTTLSPPYQGQFHSWFSDGERMLTNIGNTVWVYSRDAAQQDLITLTTIYGLAGLAGQGEWFWNNDYYTLNVFRVGASTAPAASYPLGFSDSVFVSGSVIALFSSEDPVVSIVDLAGGTPVKTDHASPLAFVGAFAARNAASWVIGNVYGAMRGELTAPAAPMRYSLGKAHSIAASNSRIAISTASSGILYFDAATQLLQGEIAVEHAKLVMSADGTRLAAAANAVEVQQSSDRTVRVYELPTETVLAEWPYSGGMTVNDITMSLSGTVIGQMLGVRSASSPARQVTHLDGTPIWSDEIRAGAGSLHLVADGSLIAAASGAPDENTATRIYAGTTLTGAIAGNAVGWIDSHRMLVNRYVPHSVTHLYDRCEIVNSAGLVSACPALPELAHFQPLTPNSIYSPERNTIYDLTSGAKLWTSAAAARGEGAVAGNFVVFASGATVRAEPR